MIQQEMVTFAEPNNQNLIQNTHSGTGGPATACCPLTSTWTQVKEIIRKKVKIAIVVVEEEDNNDNSRKQHQ